VRILKDKWEEEKGKNRNTRECIDWAFAGRSRTTQPGARKDGMIQLSHTVWDHWIDSKSDKPGPDEGDMLVQEDGDVVERGMQKHPVTGKDTEYEELWRDLEVQAFGKKHNRSTLVMRVDDPERNIRGMAIKIGGWCQGILKAEGAMTIERWEYKSDISGGDSEDVTAWHPSDEGRTRNGWFRTFRYGEGNLPCITMCGHTSGKLGLNTTTTDSKDELELDWKILEEYYW
jgi:hypothetical protein